MRLDSNGSTLSIIDSITGAVQGKASLTPVGGALAYKLVPPPGGWWWGGRGLRPLCMFSHAN